MILSIQPSPLKTKRFRILFKYNTGKQKYFDFGLKDAKKTWIDGGSESVRAAYLKRHTANPTEKNLIENNIASPALFAAKLIWGDSRDIHKNIASLNRQWKN